MIKPTKYTNIDLSILGLSSEILRLLIVDGSLKYNQILGKIIHKKGEEAKENFLLALSFLFLLGKVDYYPEEDVIILTSVNK
ncbi:ABC-three component system middle component 8 [Labilibaculum antarcticum]|uniref:Uncharacterized protein n=1 Tax=Labilibaculum antarcticum TaxID=1717717 RepID=A0A1Y1CIL2_9BACT|nr:ABC-three component system middle component 8 [Labilibaculum antarcticum]BAX80238.1 hypothetical protein ALGA_1878 [Labilibaculum antarcticum]